MIDSARVEELFQQCLSSESSSDSLLIEGVVNQAYLNKILLEQNRNEIVAMLLELPDQFRKSGGQGWSFLNACYDRHDNQWTGFHLIMEQLFMLGMGLELVSYTLPREYWSALPGGVPYITIEM